MPEPGFHTSAKLLVLLPEAFGRLNVLLRALFGAATKKDDECVSILAKVDAVTRAEI